MENFGGEKSGEVKELRLELPKENSGNSNQVFFVLSISRKKGLFRFVGWLVMKTLFSASGVSAPSFRQRITEISSLWILNKSNVIDSLRYFVPRLGKSFNKCIE